MYRYFLPVLMLLYCGYEFPTGYESIGTDKVRPIALVCNNNGLAEGAPSDTLSLHAYFGGEKIWNISWFYLSDSKNNDTISMQQIIIPNTYNEFIGTNCDSVNFSICVPDSIIRNEFREEENVKALIPQYLQGSFSNDFLKRKPDEVLDLLDFLSTNSNGVGLVVADSMIQELTGDNNSSASTVLPVLLQVFSVQLKVGAIINEKYNMDAVITIRYNRKLNYLGSYIVINRNPQINIRLCRVKGNRESFDSDKDGEDTSYNLNNSISDTIINKVGYSYFLVASRNKEIDDDCVSLSGTCGDEQHGYEWFLQDNGNLQPNDSKMIKLAKNKSRSYAVKIEFSSDSTIRSFHVWCVIYDYYTGERMRPFGFSMRNCTVILSG